MDHTQVRAHDSGDEDEDMNDTTMGFDSRPGGGFEDQLAKKLVRYALSCEFSRTPIRRQGIREKGRSRTPSCSSAYGRGNMGLMWTQYLENTRGRLRRCLRLHKSS